MKALVILATVLALSRAEAPSGGYRITDVGPNYRGYGGGSKYPLVDTYGPPTRTTPPAETTTTTTTTSRPNGEYGLPNQPFYIPPPPKIDQTYGTPQINFSPVQRVTQTTKSNIEIYRAPVQFLDEVPDYIQALVKESVQAEEIPKISNEYGTPTRSEDGTSIPQSLPQPQPQPIPQYSAPPTNLYNTIRRSVSPNVSPDQILDLTPPL